MTKETSTGTTADTMLALDELEVHFHATGSRWAWSRKLPPIRAVDGVTLNVARGETAAIVGESGSGKSTVARSILGLIAPTSGSVRFDGIDLRSLSGSALTDFRRSVQLVFQNPYSSLHPRKRIGQIIEEPLEILTTMTRFQRQSKVRELLSEVGLRPEHESAYPSAMSGGQRQRVAIARGIATGARLLVLDEPVSALDVSVRAQVLNLLERLKHELDLTYIFISHDLAVVRGFCDTINVMYSGKLVESGPANEVFERPGHPYTRALISAIPIPDPVVESQRQRIRLEGEPPSTRFPPTGCRFRTRCPLAQQICADVEPPLKSIGQNRLSACHFSREVLQAQETRTGGARR